MFPAGIALAYLTALTDPGLGISQDLAQARARQIRNLRYELNLTVPANPKERIRGSARIRFTVADKMIPTVLDFAPGLVERSNVPLRAVNGHLIAPAGVEELNIDFLLGDASLNRNPDFFYSLFVPARAHLAIPCFDQPDLKARFTVRMTVPEGWKTLSNQEPGIETEPLSTYLLFFGAGKFEIETAEIRGRRYRMFHRETDAKKVARNRDAIFDLHARAVDWLEEYTAIPYPFGKLDFMALPSFQFGGMEHAGAISYNSSGLFLEETATQSQRLGRASLISHETAHMWFGDLVTMKWFNDVWLKEVFANFMAAKMVNPSFPELNHELRFFLSHYRSAYNVDRTAGANAIRQKLANLNEAGTMYGPIIYQKSPIVMQQLEKMLGEARFRQGVREYLKRYTFGNATWDELISIFGTDLAAWSKTWIDTPGRPKVTRTKTYAGFALPDGYGEYHLDAKSRAYLLAHLPEIADPLVRAEAWSALWEDRVDLFELALRAIPLETEELNLQRLLGDLERLMWRHPSEFGRVEVMLREGMEKAKSRSIKSAYFEVYRQVAPVEWLKKVWAKELVVADLPLAEADYVKLAAELSLRGVDVRREQLERLTNPDRKAQWAFAMRGLDADPTAFFESLRDLKNRAHEPWVLEGLRYVHHPSRLAQSEKFVRPSLEMLLEIQKTGDIFFPQRWMGTTLSWYESKSAAETVKRFLAGLPKGYPERLRMTILVAADELLWRAGNTARPSRGLETPR
jgi:aminopeptidase N